LTVEQVIIIISACKSAGKLRTSIKELRLSVMEKGNSMTNKGNSVRENGTSVTNKLNSVADKGNSVREKLNSVTNKVNSVRELRPFVINGSVLGFETNPFAWFVYFAVHLIRPPATFPIRSAFIRFRRDECGEGIILWDDFPA
jgi:hypothetical protein